jgi:hypothetical protein
MDKKGIAVVGPAVVFVNLFVLIIATINVVFALGLISGIFFNKKIKDMGWRFLLPRIIIFVIVTFSIIIGTHLIVGPTYNHYIAMLFGAIFFLIIISLLSMKNIRESPKDSFMTIAVLTLLFIIISQISVWIVLKWF